MKPKIPSGSPGLRPSALDIAKYFPYEEIATQVDKPPKWFSAGEVYNQIGGRMPEQMHHWDSGLNSSCATRVSVALNKAGMSLFGANHYGSEHSPDGGKTNYITGAGDLEKCLTRKWRKGNHLVKGGTMQPVRESLKPGQVAVFAWPGHAGIVTPNYIDDFATSSSSAGSYWIVDP